MSPLNDLAMRVAIDVGPMYGHRTGVGAAVDGFVQALSETDGVELLPYLVSFRSHPADRHRKLPLPGIVASHVWSRFDHPRADRWLSGADVLHGTNYVAPPTRIPTIVSVYDCWFLAHPEQASPMIRRAAHNLHRAVARGAWVHTSSEATADRARMLLETDRVVAIHLGPPPADTSPTNHAPDRPVPGAVSRLARRPFVLAIGTEERRKDLPLLLRAFDLLAASSGDVALVLAGTAGDDSPGVDAAMRELSVSARDLVHRLGVIDDDTKRWLLRHAAVLAYPSLDEGFGFPILEAQAAGTPVVASDVGSVPEVAGAGAVLVAGRSPEAFAEALRSVVTGETGRLGLIEAGHRNVNRFSWQRTATQLRDLYRTALESGR